VAGTITAQSNGIGVVGVSPGAVSMYVVRMYGDNCGWAYVSDLVFAALKCRDAGADIINMSLGGTIGDGIEEMIFNQLYNDYGILSIASAGNDGTSDYIYPAAYGSVVSVAAVDQNNNVAGFSQKNDQVELAAPGVGILSTATTGGYVYKNGTSMAAPHVTGAAALLWSSDPGLTNEEIRQSFQDSALDLGEAGPDVAYGSGVIRSEAAYQLLGGAPTAVQVASFEATGGQGAILVEWETASEIDVIGFNIHRAETANRPEVRLNETLVPSEALGGPMGAKYAFSDEGVVGVTTYYYWLEAVGTDGGSTLHGPASAASQATATFRVLLPIVSR
jgi:subtilisin family serine protease